MSRLTTLSQAVASRAVFFPTISHVLSRSVLARAHSSSLRLKVEEIARQESNSTIEGADLSTSAECDRTANIAQQALSTRLWRTVQRGLHDPAAIRSLRPLTCSAAGEDTIVIDDPMLTEHAAAGDGEQQDEWWFDENDYPDDEGKEWGNPFGCFPSSMSTSTCWEDMGTCPDNQLDGFFGQPPGIRTASGATVCSAVDDVRNHPQSLHHIGTLETQSPVSADLVSDTIDDSLLGNPGIADCIQASAIDASELIL